MLYSQHSTFHWKLLVNKVSENLEAVLLLKRVAGSAVIYNARRISILQSHATCLSALDCRKIIVCKCLRAQ